MLKGKLVDFYSNYIANWISDGNLINRKALSSLDLKPLYDKVATKKSLKKVICVSKFPIGYNKIFPQKINNLVFKTDRDCSVIVTTSNSIAGLEVKSDIFRRQMVKIEKDYNVYANVINSLSETEKVIGGKLRDPVSGRRLFVSKDKLDRIKEEYDSYKYVYDTVKSGDRIFNTFYFIELIAPTDEKLRIIRQMVVDYLRMEDFGFIELRNSSSIYLDTFSPASFPDGVNCKEFSDMLFSSENLVYNMPYKCRGYIGDGTGALMGVDLGPKGPLVVNFFESGARQINLLCAPSGHGKTIAAFNIALGLLASNIHVSVIDIKGQEWDKLAYFTDCTVIDISDTSTTYVNTLRIDDVSCSEEDAPSYFEMSKTATVNLFKLLCAPQPEEERDVEAILTSAVMKVFESAGVFRSSPQSFKNSESLNYKNVLSMIEGLKSSHSYQYKEELITNMRTRIARYVNSSSLFRGEQITVGSIIDSPLVIYSLNKNTDSNISLEDSIRSFMISYLDMKKISIRKSQKKGTACFYEEMQRKKEFATLMNFIVAVVTGARSSNVAVFLLLNSIQTLNDEDMSPITSNLSTYIIGPVQSKKDMEFLRTLNCPEIYNLVEDITASPKKYRNVFAIQVDTGKHFGATAYKPVIPDEIMKRLSTRDVIK